MRLSGYILTVVLLAAILHGCAKPEPRIKYSENIENIIIIAVDTLRANHLGFMGYHRPTSPVIDELASRSVIFTNAYCTKSLTLPSFTCLFTGLHTIRNNIFKNMWPWDDDLHSLVTDFQSEGFDTIGWAASGIMNSRYHIDRGFNTYENPITHPQDLPVTMDLVKEKILATDGPMFLFIHTWEPHVPYEPDPEVAELFVDPGYNGPMDASVELLDAYSLGLVRPDLRPVDIQHAVDLYDGEIRWTDNMLSELLDFFEDQGLIDNSLIIFLSDHGESLGEEHTFNHRRDREVELHIPLFMHFPGDLNAGRRIPALVENTDILPTVMDILDMEIPDNIDGMSLFPLITGDTVEHRDKLLSVGINDLGPFLYSEFDGEKRYRIDVGINPDIRELSEEEMKLLDSLGYVH